MKKNVVAIDFPVLPPLLHDIFSGLESAGAPISAVFGGAVRDADLSHAWNVTRAIRDYDIRVWLPKEEMPEQWEQAFGQRLLQAFPGSVLGSDTTIGSGAVRHILHWNGVELDISVRPIPTLLLNPTPSACAQNRAGDSDVGLCAVAIGSDMHGWAEEAYFSDRANRTLTFYSSDNPKRLEHYATRMMSKFPLLRPIFLPSRQHLSLK